MKVSVIVPTYRRRTELDLALRSLATQTYEDIEIVVVDDNADAEWNSAVKKIVEDICKEFEGISLKYIANSENKGSAETRNVGIKASDGEYITFLDDDDVYLPDKVKRQVSFMQSEGSDYSITDLYIYSANDTLIDRRIRNYIQKTSTEDLQQYHLMYHMTGTDTMMFKKDYLMKIGCFDPIDVGDEFYLMQKAIAGEGKFGYLQGCDVKAYIHTGEGGLSSGEGKINGENMLYEYKKQYFDRITPQAKRYIRMRHYAVIAFAEIRRKHIFAFMTNALKSFFCAPVFFIKMVLGK